MEWRPIYRYPTKFCVVRNPFERMLSQFSWLKGGKCPETHELMVHRDTKIQENLRKFKVSSDEFWCFTSMCLTRGLAVGRRLVFPRLPLHSAGLVRGRPRRFKLDEAGLAGRGFVCRSTTSWTVRRECAELQLCPSVCVPAHLGNLAAAVC